MSSRSLLWLAILALVIPLALGFAPDACARQSGDPAKSTMVLGIGHTGTAGELTTSPDGRWLAAWDSEGTIVWDLRSGSHHLRLADVRPWAFSSDGDFFVGGSGGPGGTALDVWETETGKRVVQITGTAVSSPRAVAFARADNKIYCINSVGVSCWETLSGAQISVGEPVGGVQPGADKRYRVTVTADGQVIHRPGQLHKYTWMAGASFSSGAQRAAVIDSNGIHLLDLENEREIRIVEARGAKSVEMSPDGRLVAATFLGSAVRIWRVDDGVELPGFKSVQYGPAWVVFSPDSTLLAGLDPESGKVTVWDIAAVREARALMTEPRGASGRVLAFTRDGLRLIASNGARGIALWNMADGTIVRRLGGGNVASGGDLCAAPVAFSPDGSLLAYEGADGRASFWNVDSGNHFSTLGEGSGRLTALAFTADGRRLVTTGIGNTWNAYEVRSGQRVDGTPYGWNWYWDVACSPNGSDIAASTATSSLRLFRGKKNDRADGLAFDRAGVHGWVKAVAFSADGAFVVGGSATGEIKAFPVAGGAERTLQAPGAGAWIWDLAMSQDGRYMVVGDSSGASIWDFAAGRVETKLNTGEGWVTAVAFGRSGSLIATGGGDGSVRLWDTASGQVVRQFGRHAAAVWGLAFNPNGKQLASADAGGTIRLWDVDTGAELRTIVRGQPAPAGLRPDPAEVKLSPDTIRSLLRTQPDCRASVLVENEGKSQRLRNAFARKAGATRIDMDLEGESFHVLFRPGQLPVRLYPGPKKFEEDEDLTMLYVAVPFALLGDVATQSDMVFEHVGYTDIAGNRCATIRISQGKSPRVTLLYAARDLGWLAIRMEAGDGKLSMGFQEGSGPDAWSLVDIKPAADASLFVIPKGYTRHTEP